jgi:hypothetical protein
MSALFFLISVIKRLLLIYGLIIFLMIGVVAVATFTPKTKHS